MLSGNEHLPLHLPGLVVAGQAFQLFDEHLTLFLGDELAGLHGIHQQLQLRQLKSAAGQIIATAPAAGQLHIHAAPAQGVNVAVNALALGGHTRLFQRVQQLGHAEHMFFIGFSLKNLL